MNELTFYTKKPFTIPRGKIMVQRPSDHAYYFIDAPMVREAKIRHWWNKPLREKNVLEVIGTGLIFLLKVIWFVVKWTCVIVGVFTMLHDLGQVQQMISGPNSIPNTNANINNFINQQNQQSLTGQTPTQYRRW
jgi:hypothetical protein